MIRFCFSVTDLPQTTAHWGSWSVKEPVISARVYFSSAPPSASLLGINPISAILITALIRGRRGELTVTTELHLTIYTARAGADHWMGERTHVTLHFNWNCNKFEMAFCYNPNWKHETSDWKNWEANDRSQMLLSINQVDKQIVTLHYRDLHSHSSLTSLSSL